MLFHWKPFWPKVSKFIFHTSGLRRRPFHFFTRSWAVHYHLNIDSLTKSRIPHVQWVITWSGLKPSASRCDTCCHTPTTCLYFVAYGSATGCSNKNCVVLYSSLNLTAACFHNCINGLWNTLNQNNLFMGLCKVKFIVCQYGKKRNCPKTLKVSDNGFQNICANALGSHTWSYTDTCMTCKKCARTLT